MKGKGQESNVRKDRARNPMLERIAPEFKCFKGQGLKSSVKKDRAGIPTLERKGLEF